MRGSRFFLSLPAPAYFLVPTARTRLVSGQPMIGGAAAGVAAPQAPGHEPGIYHVSVAMREASVTISTSSLPIPANASAATASAWVSNVSSS